MSAPVLNGKPHVPDWRTRPAFETARLLWPEVPWRPTESGLIAAAQVQRLSRNPAEFPGALQGLRYVLQDRGAGLLVGTTILNLDTYEDIARCEYRLKELGHRSTWALEIVRQIAHNLAVKPKPEGTPEGAEVGEVSVLDVAVEVLALQPAVRAAVVFLVTRSVLGREPEVPAPPAPPAPPV